MPGRGPGERVNAIVDTLREARDFMRAEPVRRLLRLLREGAGWILLGTLVTWISIPLFMLCTIIEAGS